MTRTRVVEKTLLVDYCSQTIEFNIERYRKIKVARSPASPAIVSTTVTTSIKEINIEDHNSKGTCFHFDGREVFLFSDSMKVGNSESISSRPRRESSPGAPGLITYQVVEKSGTLSAA